MKNGNVVSTFGPQIFSLKKYRLRIINNITRVSYLNKNGFGDFLKKFQIKLAVFVK